MKDLRFDFRDIFKAPRFALSLQRIAIQLGGLILGYFVYLVLTYLSFLSAGDGLKETWNKFGLIICPFLSGTQFPWYSWVIFGVASLFLVTAYLLSATAVARVTYMMFKGNNFYSMREAYVFAFRKFFSVLATPLVMVVMIGLLLLGGVVAGLFGKIPFVGELTISLFLIVSFFAAFGIFFLAVITVIALVLAPAILATTDEDAFESVFLTFSITWKHVWRLVFYQGINIVLALLALGITAFVAKQSLLITNWIFGQIMGNDFINLASNGLYYVQSWTLMAQDLLTRIYAGFTPKIFFSKDFYFIPDLGFSLQLSSILYALSLLFIGACVFSYGLASLNIGNTIIFIVLKKHEDNENLLERKDREEETEEDENLSEVKEQEETTKQEEKPEDLPPASQKNEPCC